MRNKLLGAFLVFQSLSALQTLEAQVLPCPPTILSSANAGGDQDICPGVCVNLNGFSTTTLTSSATYQADTIAYNPYAYDQGTSVIVNQDDVWSDVITLPFAFCYFGDFYNAIVIGSNGNISFNTNLANGFCNYSVFNAIPFNYDSYNNCIMSPFFDLDPRAIGRIRYATYGVAPCRKFVVSYDSVATFPCGTGPSGGGCQFVNSQQIVLYETINTIEINVKNHNFYNASTSSGNAVLGIQNDAATLAYSFPGRNNAQWNETNKSYRFTPNALPTVTYQWVNLNTNAVIGNTSTINVCPTEETEYEFTATYLTACDQLILKDTVKISISDSVDADFDFDIAYGCGQDTVTFTNRSKGATAFRWNFGDGTSSLDTNPVHIYYNTQNIYTVKLNVEGTLCKDSIEKTVDLNHPLIADFSADSDSICQNGQVEFTNLSTATSRLGIDPSYIWFFGDGDSSIDPNPIHIFDSAGTFQVMLVVKDFVPCTDTIIKTIVVDPTPIVTAAVSDSFICEGSPVTFTASRTDEGLIETWWDFGDFAQTYNVSNLTHAYDTSGNFTPTFTAQYRFCGAISIPLPIQVNPQPVIDLGPDTFYCPGSKPVVVRDLVNELNPSANWLWNTGATTAAIDVKHHGRIVSTVTINGCSSTDSIMVYKDCYLDIPNAFSPNNDNDNDFFLPRQLLSRGVEQFEMTIYNRWGEKVYFTDRIDGRGWDGKFGGADQPVGVYIYLIEAGFKNGVRESYKGNITLLR